MVSGIAVVSPGKLTCAVARPLALTGVTAVWPARLKVTVPWLTGPPGLITWAVSVTVSLDRVGVKSTWVRLTLVGSGGVADCGMSMMGMGGMNMMGGMMGMRGTMMGMGGMGGMGGMMGNMMGGMGMGGFAGKGMGGFNGKKAL